MTDTPGDQPPRPEQPEQPRSGPEPSQEQWPTTPYPQQPYPSEHGGGPPPPGGYPPAGYPPAGYPPVQYAPDHPRATTSLVLGIIGVVACQVLGPVAWWMGKKTLDEIDASGGRYGGRGAAQAGYVLGVVGTVLLALGLVFLVLYVLFFAIVIGGSMVTSYG